MRWKPPPERRIRQVLVIGSLLLSAAGIAVAAYGTKDPLDAGRGGALAVLLTLTAYFLRHDIGLQVRQAITVTSAEIKEDLDALSGKQKTASPAPAQTVEQLATRMQAIETSTSIDQTSDDKMNRAVAAAALVGNLAWGFGDLAAKWLMG